jgi:hypothetical protein
MRRKKMHDMWDPLTSTLYDMWDPLTVLNCHPFHISSLQPNRKKGQSHSNLSFATKHEKGWAPLCSSGSPTKHTVKDLPWARPWA